jgi:hypothetical protein
MAEQPSCFHATQIQKASGVRMLDFDEVMKELETIANGQI